MDFNIRILDSYHPEDSAMLQALYSRDPGPISEKLEQLSNSQSGRFMEKYYVGYGHKSIGDCGVTTIFIEGISLYEAKLIEDSPLFSGQEASTRYIDFSAQGLVELSVEEELLAVYWLERYKDLYEAAQEDLVSRYGDVAGIKPCAFDIARSLLPLGMRTSLAWTTSLSHAREHLMKLSVHPLERVRKLAARIHTRLKETYPHSFSDTDLSIAHMRYDGELIWQPLYHLEDEKGIRRRGTDVLLECDISDPEYLKRLIGTRALDYRSRVRVHGWLDFGSLRDLHRHRPAYIPLPFRQIQQGSTFLESDLYAQKIDRIMGRCWREHLQEVFTRLPVSGGDNILLYPLGTQTPVEITTGLSHLAYIVKLRSDINVHPTLRDFIHRLLHGLGMYRGGKALIDALGDKIDWQPPAFVPSAARANQTIQKT